MAVELTEITYRKKGMVTAGTRLIKEPWIGCFYDIDGLSVSVVFDLKHGAVRLQRRNYTLQDSGTAVNRPGGSVGLQKDLETVVYTGHEIENIGMLTSVRNKPLIDEVVAEESKIVSFRWVEPK